MQPVFDSPEPKYSRLVAVSQTLVTVSWAPRASCGRDKDCLWEAHFQWRNRAEPGRYSSRICVAELTVQLPEEKQGLGMIINRPESSSSTG